nr:RNA-binding region RNP-1 (RNA recognition motif) [Medicago truncatula]
MVKETKTTTWSWILKTIRFAFCAALSFFLLASQPRKLKLGNPTQVYVCNLPRSCDTHHLLHLFTPHGTVLSTEVCRNAETGESKGSAYVTMGSYNAAKNALAALDGSDVGGREMLVKFSVETLNSPPMRRRTIYYEGPHKVYVGNLW